MAALIPMGDPEDVGLVFAYLAVRPKSKSETDLRVECVECGVGNLAAKIRAKNDCTVRIPCARTGKIFKWRVLVGFYTHLNTWKRKIKPKWSQKKVWEIALLSGLRFAYKYGVKNTLYVSSEAQSEPRSALLCALQRLRTEGGAREGRNCTARKEKKDFFWKVVVSASNNLRQLENILAL